MEQKRLAFPLALALAAALALPPGAAHARRLFETQLGEGGSSVAYDGTDKLRNVSDMYEEANLDMLLPGGFDPLNDDLARISHEGSRNAVAHWVEGDGRQ